MNSVRCAWRFRRPIRGILAAGWVLSFITSGAAWAQTVEEEGRAIASPTAAILELSTEAHESINERMGLLDSTIVALNLDGGLGEPLNVRVPLDGGDFTLSLAPRSILAEGYQLLVQIEGGAVVRHEPGPTRTMRGTVLEVPGSAVAASLLDSGLFARIAVAPGEEFWMEPVETAVASGSVGMHVLYRGRDIIPSGGSCGADALAYPEPFTPPDLVGGGPRAACGGEFCLAELACDADYEYFLDYGSSVTSVEDRITSIVNSLNVQYERDVEITHEITAIIVRSTSNDPYSSNSIDTHLTQFRNYWQSNHGNIQRDLAQLFSGKSFDSSAIGLAWVGTVCSSLGYSVVENCCSFGCLTDLSAHEMGHNWNAGHCSCTAHTMNPSLRCANQFNPTETIPTIVGFRNFIAGCLDAMNPPPPNDECAGATPAADGSLAFTTIGATTSAVGLPGSCDEGSGLSFVDDIWFTYVPQCMGDATVSVCSSDYDTRLSIHLAGSCLGAFVACDDDSCGSQGSRSSVTFPVTSGTTYLIRLGGFSGWGSGTMSISCAGPPGGACCHADNSCTIDTQTNCGAAGGSYYGDGTDCSPNPCFPNTGACCFGDGSCLYVPHSACDSTGGAYQGDHVECDPNPCPPPTGACCFNDGSCSVLLVDDCTSLGGIYQGNGAVCAQGLCPATTGACCAGDGSCVEQTDTDCNVAGGTYWGDNTTCDPNPCPQVRGACCLTGTTCLFVTVAGCAGFGGIYRGDNVPCDPGVCPPPSGGCCHPDGSCTEEPQATCAAGGWFYQGDGTACTPNPCPQPTGACCHTDGSCTTATAAVCGAAGGVYQGADTSCSPNPCPQPTGACCQANGVCATETATSCAGLGGTYQGDGTDCAPNPCPQPTGACCHADGSCTTETAADCATAGGVHQGDDTPCSPNPCPQPTGACCQANGACATETATSCAGLGGAYQGDETLCTPNPCPQPTGACCHPDGSCTTEIAADCGTAGGAYEGDDTLCSPNPCPQPFGACCFSGGSCFEGSPDDCLAAGAVFAGDATACTPNACLPSCPPGFLPGDMDGDDDVDGEDIQGFADALVIESREASDVCPADFDGSLIVDSGDIPGMVAALLQ